MICSSYTFHVCYSAVSPLQAYFLPSHGNREATVLEKLPYMPEKKQLLILGDKIFSE
jgi:hypothetical protein